MAPKIKKPSYNKAPHPMLQTRKFKTRVFYFEATEVSVMKAVFLLIFSPFSPFLKDQEEDDITIYNFDTGQ
jgi:hypothetical protein